LVGIEVRRTFAIACRQRRWRSSPPCHLASPRARRAYLDLPDPADGHGIQVALNDSGKLISIPYSSPEATAELVTWVLNRFSPPDVTVQLFEWRHHPRVTPRTTVQDLLAIGPMTIGPSAHRQRGCRSAPSC
jgi:hypothetical protein